MVIASEQLDGLDRKILRLLREDARQSMTEMADELEVVPNTIRNRIQDLEEDRVIKGYSADIDYEQLGATYYCLFICTITVQEQESVVEDIRDVPGVVEVLSLMTGEQNVHVRAVANSKSDVASIACKLSDLDLSLEEEYLIWNQCSGTFDISQSI